MSDKPVEGRETALGGQSEEMKPTGEVKHNKTTTKKPLNQPPGTGRPAGGIELKPTVQGTEMIVALKLLEMINTNLAFLARTIHDHLHPDKKGKDVG